MNHDAHRLAVCPTCDEETRSAFPDPHYKLKTTPCFECSKPLCIGECRSQARHCASIDCGSLICGDCRDGRTGDDLYCSACERKLFDTPEQNEFERRLFAVRDAVFTALLADLAAERDPSGVYL